MTASECKRFGKHVKPEEDVKPAMLGSHSGQKPYIAAALRAAVLREASGFDSPPQRLIYNCRASIKSFASRETETDKQETKKRNENGSFPRNTTPKLIVLCGPTHSGKSSFAGELKDFVIVNSDSIRKEITGEYKLSDQEGLVWETFSARKSDELKNKRDIVLDACHMSSKARWHALQGADNDYRKICIVFDLPERVIERRCIRENRISLGIAKGMWKSFQKSKPSEEKLKKEGFDDVYFVKNRKLISNKKREVKP